MYADFGILILRLMLGLSIAGHGSQKLFGWFGGSGWQGWVNTNRKIGLRPAPFWALLGGLSEFGGGLLLALGFLNPLGPLGIIAAMAMATRTHWPKGYWSAKGGFEYPLTILVAALALALTGPGAYSVDSLTHIILPEPVSLMFGIVLVLLGLLVAVQSQALARRSPIQAENRSS